MGRLQENEEYRKQIKFYGEGTFAWDELTGKSFFITGGSGMIGTVLIDILLYRNEVYKQNIRITALGRDRRYAEASWGDILRKKRLFFVCRDINEPLMCSHTCDYVIHMAGNTHPAQYAADPVGTILTSVAGTKNVLDYAYQAGAEKTVFISSVEIYGENRGETERFCENYCGYLDCNRLRSGYPEGKRLAEALCQAYIDKFKMNIAVGRPGRVYGPTMRWSDSKAVAQFIANGVKKENIILRSGGNQLYSYAYAGDVAMAVLYILLYGTCGEAYNIADKKSEIRLKDLARLCAQCGNSRVVYIPFDEKEKKGYSGAVKSILDAGKIERLGWSSCYGIEEGIRATIQILRECGDCGSDG